MGAPARPDMATPPVHSAAFAAEALAQRVLCGRVCCCCGLNIRRDGNGVKMPARLWQALRNDGGNVGIGGDDRIAQREQEAIIIDE